MDYYYSATMNAFYPVSLKQNYIDAGSFPSDAIEVSLDLFLEFSRKNIGKVRGADENGLPVWISTPEPTQNELIESAKYKKQSLLKEISSSIDILQDAVNLGIATNDEIAALNENKERRVLISRVDVSLAPNISWP
ncbi:tail fiber assembly protein [Providencia rettgeri]